MAPCANTRYWGDLVGDYRRPGFGDAAGSAVRTSCVWSRSFSDKPTHAGRVLDSDTGVVHVLAEAAKLAVRLDRRNFPNPDIRVAVRIRSACLWDPAGLRRLRAGLLAKRSGRAVPYSVTWGIAGGVAGAG